MIKISFVPIELNKTSDPNVWKSNYLSNTLSSLDIEHHIIKMPLQNYDHVCCLFRMIEIWVLYMKAQALYTEVAT